MVVIILLAEHLLAFVAHDGIAGMLAAGVALIKAGIVVKVWVGHSMPSLITTGPFM